jgi:hypothetical protein
MAMAWLPVVQSFSDPAPAPRWRCDVGPGHFSTVFALNLAVGVLLTAVGIDSRGPAPGSSASRPAAGGDGAAAQLGGSLSAA